MTTVYEMCVCCRCTCVLPSTYISTVKYLSSQPTAPPKRPLNGYMRYVLQQQPLVSKQFPGKSATHLGLLGERQHCSKNYNTRNLVLRLQISGHHQEDRPGMENNESWAETGFLHLYFFLAVTIIICHKCIIYIGRQKICPMWEHSAKSILRLPLIPAYIISHRLFALCFNWSWGNRNADCSGGYIVLKCR